MKRLAPFATAIVALATYGTAQAADIPVKAPAYKPACAQFGGMYVGGHAGSVTHDRNWIDRNAWARNTVDLALPDSSQSSTTAWHAGVQLGWDMQSGCTVFGIIADWSWAGLKQEKYYTDGQPGLALDQLLVQSEVRWFGTVRTRTGVVVDNLLLYVTGGLAYAHIDHSAALTNAVAAVFVTETFSSGQTRWGWTAGVGTEWAWSRNFSIVSEVLYARLAEGGDTFNSNFAALLAQPPRKDFSYQDSLWVTRIGLNYRWGG